MAAPVAVQRARQAMDLNDFAQAPERRVRAFLFDQDGRIDIRSGVVQGHDQVQRPAQAFDPFMRRAVLVQHHAAHRAAGPLLAMRSAPRRAAQQARPLQCRLRPGVTPGEVMVPDKVLVKMLRRETRIHRSVQSQNLLDNVRRHTSQGRFAEPTVVQTVKAIVLMTNPPTPERPFAHTQNLSRFNLAQLMTFPSVQNTFELHQSQSLQHRRPVHPNLLTRSLNQTGQLVCYKHRTYRVLLTVSNHPA